MWIHGKCNHTQSNTFPQSLPQTQSLFVRNRSKNYAISLPSLALNFAVMYSSPGNLGFFLFPDARGQPDRLKEKLIREKNNSEFWTKLQVH